MTAQHHSQPRAWREEENLRGAASQPGHERARVWAGVGYNRHGKGGWLFYDIALCDDVNMKKGVGQKGALRGRDQTNSATVFLSAGWVS